MAPAYIHVIFDQNLIAQILIICKLASHGPRHTGDRSTEIFNRVLLPFDLKRIEKLLKTKIFRTILVNFAISKRTSYMSWSEILARGQYVDLS